MINSRKNIQWTVAHQRYRNLCSHHKQHWH